MAYHASHLAETAGSGQIRSASSSRSLFIFSGRKKTPSPKGILRKIGRENRARAIFAHPILLKNPLGGGVFLFALNVTTNYFLRQFFKKSACGTIQKQTTGPNMDFQCFLQLFQNVQNKPN